MSHFTVMILGENPEEQLKPFDENLETERYVKYTKEQIIENGKKDIERYKNGIYAEYLKDPVAYAEKYTKNDKHLNYVANEFPLMLEWSEEQIYQHEIRWYEPHEIGSSGEVYSECNPNSKWDWYVLGGRWSGLIKLKDGTSGKMGRSGTMGNEVGIDQAKKGDIANFDELVTFALIKDGKWFERGEMGWWGFVADEKEEDAWDNEFKKLIKDLPDDTLISIYDCHI